MAQNGLARVDECWKATRQLSALHLGATGGGVVVDVVVVDVVVDVDVDIDVDVVDMDVDGRQEQALLMRDGTHLERMKAGRPVV